MWQFEKMEDLLLQDKSWRPLHCLWYLVAQCFHLELVQACCNIVVFKLGGSRGTSWCTSRWASAFVLLKRATCRKATKTSLANLCMAFVHIHVYKHRMCTHANAIVIQEVMWQSERHVLICYCKSPYGWCQREHMVGETNLPCTGPKPIPTIRVGMPRFSKSLEYCYMEGTNCSIGHIPSMRSNPMTIEDCCIVVLWWTFNATPKTTLSPWLCPTSAAFSCLGFAKAPGITHTNLVHIQFSPLPP